MCKFFSCISNGKGRTLFFTIEDIAKEMSTGNKKGYQWNSHTSIADFYGIKGAKEDEWNRWKYDVDSKELKLDQLNTADDREKVSKNIENYLKDKDIMFLLNLYNCNSGDWNSGNRNSGDSNTGHRNSGNRNSGDSNTGCRNSGNRNSGDWNSGDWNSGNSNTGCRNSGNRNSGNRNSGNWNSGDWNSGFFNTDTPTVRLFNKDSKMKPEQINFPKYLYFNLTQWVTPDTATDEEKIKYKTEISTCGGFIKTIPYKEAFKKAWDNASLEEKKATLQLPNFDWDIFTEITGIEKVEL